MQMTSCFYYGQDCSDCDDSEGVPSCYKSRWGNCERCGASMDIDVGCLRCDHGDVDDNELDIDDPDIDDLDPDKLTFELDCKDGDGRYYEQIDKALI